MTRVSAAGRLNSLVARRAAKRVPQPVRVKLGLKPRAHLLHIRKTGGTALKDAFESLAPGEQQDYKLVLHAHNTRLRDVPAGDKVFFVLRDPADRFVSGFNSRLRRGQPRYDNPWTAGEATAFGHFTTPEALALALQADDPKTRAAAEAAMGAISHVRHSYWDWFESPEYLQSRLEDVLFVQWLPDLNDCFGELCRRLGLRSVPELPNDAVRQHRSPDGVDRHLSPQARAHLQTWYERDYALLDFCATLDSFVGPSFAAAADARGRASA